MGLEQCVACEELDQNASDTPDVARIRPAEAEDDLGSPVMSGRYDGRMIFVLECSGSEIDEADFRVQEHTSLVCLTRNRGGRGGYLAIVRECLIVIVTKKNILRFQIGMDKVQIVEDCGMLVKTKKKKPHRSDELTSNTGEQLAGKVLDLAVRERHEVVALEEVEDALAQQVHDDADMSAVVEAVSEMYAPIAVRLVVGLQRAQDPEFDLARIAVLLDRADDLDGDAVVSSPPVDGLDDLAEGALS